MRSWTHSNSLSVICRHGENLVVLKMQRTRAINGDFFKLLNAPYGNNILSGMSSQLYEYVDLIAVEGHTMKFIEVATENP